MHDFRIATSHICRPSCRTAATSAIGSVPSRKHHRCGARGRLSLSRTLGERHGSDRIVRPSLESAIIRVWRFRSLAGQFFMVGAVVVWGSDGVDRIRRNFYRMAHLLIHHGISTLECRSHAKSKCAWTVDSTTLRWDRHRVSPFDSDLRNLAAEEQLLLCPLVLLVDHRRSCRSSLALRSRSHFASHSRKSSRVGAHSMRQLRL